MQAKTAQAAQQSTDPLRSETLTLSTALPARAPESELRSFRLGEERQAAVEVAPGLKQSFDVRSISRGNGQPDIQFMNELDFKRLASLEGRTDGAVLRSIFARDENVIRVAVPGSGSTPLPERIELSLPELKRLSATLVHESALANGGSEFDAMYATFRRLKENGVIEEIPSGQDIMEHIRHHHGQDVIDRALESFERFDEDGYIQYIFDRDFRTPSLRPAEHDYEASYRHAVTRSPDLAVAPPNLSRLAWDQKHPFPLQEYRHFFPGESVQQQTDLYQGILNRKHFEDACPLEVPKDAKYRTFSRRVETTQYKEEYLQGHMEWKGEMIPGQGWVHYEARYHTNTRVNVPGFPPSLVLHRRIGQEEGILMRDTPELRSVMNDPAEKGNFKIDASGNIWLAGERWQEARDRRGKQDTALLGHGHHAYFPCDEKGRILHGRS